MTATHFWSTVEYNRNHHGNAYVWITGAGQKTKLWILPSEAVKVWVDSGGVGVGRVNNAIWYVYTLNGEQYKIPSESMLHFRSSTSFDGITGKSVREILADTLTGNQTAQQMLNKAYESGFTGKAVLQVHGEASARTRKRYGTAEYKTFLDGTSGKGCYSRLLLVRN